MNAWIGMLAVALFAQTPGNVDDRYPPSDVVPWQDEQPLIETQNTPSAESSLPAANESASAYDSNSLAATEPEQTSDASESSTKPSELLKRLLTPVSQPLAGYRLTLAETLTNGSSNREQTRLAEHYWELAFAVAKHYEVQRTLIEVQTLREPISQPAPSWQVWQVELEDRARMAQHRALALQRQLAAAIGRPDTAALPLPTDLPHCGKYDSRYDQIFANRLSHEARQLDELLPLQYKNLRQEAKQVASAYEWLDLVSRQRNPADQGETLLHAYRLIAAKRSQFLNFVYDYNRAIARYTELALSSRVDAQRRVATLILVDSANKLDWQRGGIQRTSAEFPEENGSSHKSHSKSLDGQRRSIVVPPQ